MAVERMGSSDNICELAKELGANRALLYRWRGQLEETPAHETPEREQSEDPRQTPRGEQCLKTCLSRERPGSGFFQGCLAKSRGSSPAEQELWREGIYDQIREVMPMQGRLSIERMCYLAQVSRAGFYRSMARQTPAEEDLEVRSAIQKIAIEHGRRYGYRRITAELRRQGMQVNGKRVARIMREDDLLAIQPRAFVVTTDSSHELEVHLNLAGFKTI